MEDANSTGKLNFEAPLLSTRHPGGFPRTLSQGTSRDTSTRVPFSWEQAPGKPKDMPRFEDEEELPPPPPCLPPGMMMRWQHPAPPKEGSIINDLSYEDDDDDWDDDRDMDVDVDVDVDVFSHAIDMFSLSDALDHIVEAAEKQFNGQGGGSGGGGGLKAEVLKSSGSESPSFIIQRFLPAAQALAAVSSTYSLNGSNTLQRIWRSKEAAEEEKEEEYVRGRSYSSCRATERVSGCGLEFFFPWRMKHKLCGLRSPITHPPPKNFKPHSATTAARHMRNYSLPHTPPLRDYA